MGQMVVLSAEEVSKVLTIEDAIAAVEEAYRQKATGKGVAWPMVYEQFEPGVADMDIRSGESREAASSVSSSLLRYLRIPKGAA